MSTGQLRADGEFLANPTGGPDDILVVAGQLIVTGPVATVGYRRVIVAGQMLAPRDAQAVLGPALVVKGQLAWYTGQPRIFVGKETFGRSFFELLDRPASLALLGRFDIDPDVPPDLLREDPGHHLGRQAGRAQAARRSAPAPDNREDRHHHGGPE